MDVVVLRTGYGSGQWIVSVLWVVSGRYVRVQVTSYYVLVGELVVVIVVIDWRGVGCLYTSPVGIPIPFPTR